MTDHEPASGAPARGRAPDLAPAQGRAPDFYIVGHLKSGTTALYRQLQAHSQTYMPVKEPWFFETAPGSPAPPRPAAAGPTPATLEEYLALFDASKPGQLVGEATPTYLLSRFAAGRIAEVQPAARIIAILREPASFLHSLHLQMLRVHIENEPDLRRAMTYEQARRAGEHLSPQKYWPEMLQYSEHVRYVEQLQRFHAHFPSEQILVLIYDDFRADNLATVRKVLRFLELDDARPVRARDLNPARRVRARRLNDLIHAVATGDGRAARSAQAAARTLAPRRLTRESAVAIKNRLLMAPPRPPDATLMAELRARFKPEVVALSEYLGRDLATLWGNGAGR